MMSDIDTRSRTMEDFHGDFDQLAELMERSWSENRSQSLLYTAEYLQSYFRYPGANYQLAPTIYYGSKPIGFVAGFPRFLQYMGKKRNILVVAFLTASPEHKKKGYGIVLWRELVRRAQALKFDGMVNYCLEGEAMNGMILRCCRMLSLPAVEICTVSYWSRVLLPRKMANTEPAGDETLTDMFIDLARDIPHRVPVARVWSEREAEWQCRLRNASVVAKLQSGSRRGMLVGHIMPIANATRTKCLFVEDVLWGDLEAEERSHLLNILLTHKAMAGVQMAVAPYLGYADFSTFHAARFRPSNRTLHAYLTLWNGDTCCEAPSSMYLDVF